jgi:uncharacterized protein YukE
MNLNNPEYAEIVRMASPLAPLLAAMGIHPVHDLEKLNINYDLYTKGEKEAEAAFAAVRDAGDQLARVRDEVADRWMGTAADKFERYADRVVNAGAAERALIDQQDQATTAFFTEIKQNVQAAHDAIMNALAGLVALGAPVAGVLVHLERMASGNGDFPEIDVPLDPAALAEVILKAIGNIVDLPKKFDEAKIEADTGPLALRDTADFRIAPDYSQGAVPTGLDDNEKNPEAWQTE